MKLVSFWYVPMMSTCQHTGRKHKHHKDTEALLETSREDNNRSKHTVCDYVSSQKCRIKGQFIYCY